MLGRISVISCILIALCGLMCPGAPLDGASTRAALDQLARANAKVSTIMCDFVSESTGALLSEPVTAKGKLWLTRQGNMRMSVFGDNGEEEVFVFEGKTGRMAVGLPGAMTAVKDPTGGLLVSVFEIATGKGLTGNITRDYVISCEDKGAQRIFTFVPVKKALKAICPRFVLTVDRGSSRLQALAITSGDGTCTEYFLKNVRINRPIDPAVFNL